MNCSWSKSKTCSVFSIGSAKIVVTILLNYYLLASKSGQVNQTCGQDGKWDGQPISCKEVECGQVPGLANGEIHVLNGRTNWGARVKYKCKNDYSLMGGEPERTCLEQGWSGKPPTMACTRLLKCLVFITQCNQNKTFEKPLND